jgi:hypothetical protein
LPLHALKSISWTLILWSGLTAVVVSTWLLMLLRSLGATRYLPRAYWSCALFAGTGNASLILAGLLRMIALVAVFPFIYTAIFVYTGRAEAVVGLIIGLVHGLLAGIMLPLAARRCSGANPPGLLGFNLGKLTPLILLFVHGVYGSVIGYIYVNG